MKLVFHSLLLFFWISLSTTQAEVRVLTTPFAGDDEWGKAISIALNLRLFSGLRRVTANEQPLPSARLLWNKEPLSAPNHSNAIEAGRRPENSSVIVVWGKTYSLPGEVAVMSFATLPNFSFLRPEDEIFEKWNIALPGGTKLSADMPKRDYRFRAFTLSKEFLKKYENPNSIRIHRNPSERSKVIATVNEQTIRALKINNNWAQIRTSNSGTGWIEVPDLGKEAESIVSFLDGLVRFYRGDWTRAKNSFEKAIDSKDLSFTIEYSALLHLLRVNSELNIDPSNEIEEVFLMDDFSIPGLQQASMAVLHRCLIQKSEMRLNCKLMMQDIFKRLQQSSNLFQEEDQWFSQTLELIGKEL